jgi:lipoate---protein ligase
MFDFVNLFGPVKMPETGERTMLVVDNQNVTDPRLNLAIEEYLLRHVQADEPILFFYINEPAVVIGRNQNPLEEADPRFLKAQGIHLVRRLSGGGAVYHDPGNLNFSFIVPGRQDLHNFVKFTGPVIQVLGRLGVPAELQGRSSLFTNGQKISGNAQYAGSGRMFSHGTLLFDTDLEMMRKALNPGQAQFESRAIQSVRSSVTNLRHLLPSGMTIAGLKQAILEGAADGSAVAPYPLSPADWDQIRRISAERYQRWAWNYGRTPRFTVQKSGRFPAGRLAVQLEVKDGLIQKLQIEGDFAGLKKAAELQGRLVGGRYDPEALAAVLAGIDLRPYLGSLTQAEFLALLY